MAGPLRLGSRLLWIALLVSWTLAAPNQDRRKLKVTAAFGARPKDAAAAAAASDAGRALPLAAEEPKIITEPLPGQEFVFISANPSNSGDPAGRSARINHQVESSHGRALAPPPSARVEIGNVPTVVDEDGILVAARPLDETLQLSPPVVAARAGRQAFQEPKLEPFIVLAQDWTSLNLDDSGVVSSSQDTESDRSGFGRALAPPPPPVPQQFTLSDALAEDSPADAAQGSAADARKADSEDDNVVPAESVSTRSVIKKAPNGQDYEYEYLYYDEGDIVPQSVAQEPSLLEADRAVVVPAPVSADEPVTEQPEIVAEATTAPAVEAATVSEEPQIAVEAWTVGVEDHHVDNPQEDAVEGDVGGATSPNTSTSTTEEPSTLAAASKRRRPTRPAKSRKTTKTVDKENRSGLSVDDEEEAITRFPPRAKLGDSEDAAVQARLRVIDSSSFRSPGGSSSGERVVETDSFRNNPTVESSAVENEPITVGRLTVISGPARLPSPAVVVEKESSIEEQDDEPKTHVKGFDSEEHDQVKVTDEPLAIEAVPFEQTSSHDGILKSIREEFEQRLKDESQREEAEEEHHEESPAKEIAPTRPAVVDLLAFSRAAQADEDQAEPAIEEQVVVVDEVPLATTAPTLVSEIELTETTPEVVEEAPVVRDEIAQLEDAARQPSLEGSPVVELEVVEHSEQPANQEDPVLVTDEPTPEPVQEEEEETVPPTTTTTTTSTTTTTEATTTAATEAPARVRGTNRFGSSNSNKFANRIRNRERDGTVSAVRPATTTSTTTTAAPTRRSNLRTNNFNNRLRRPTTTEAPAVEQVADNVELDDATPSTAAPSARRTTPSIRNRFNLRRNMTTSDSSSDEAAVTSTTTRRPTTERRQPSPRTRPSSASSNSRPAGDSARPVSPLFRRGRPTSTTTTAAPEPSVAPVLVEEAGSATEPTKTEDDSSVEVVKEEVVTEPSTTSTTTKLTGLNRLRNRNPIAVSERPRVVRPQISVDDRRIRNRMRNGSNNKKAPELAVVDNGLEREEKPLDNAESKVVDESNIGEEEPVEAAATAGPFRGLRQRRPGQFASNRRGSS